MSDFIPNDLYEKSANFIDRATFDQLISDGHQCFHHIINDMIKGYQDNLKPLEVMYSKFTYKDPVLEDAYFVAKPMILLIGQYSSGKSTFAKYLIGDDYPGMRIGPEPTTDKCVAVMYGQEKNIIPGNALVLDSSRPFKGLEKFGTHFLNRFEGSFVNSDVLKGTTVIDTPGILSSHVDNSVYDYKGAIDFFAKHSDRIFLFIDANKLELSEDFQQIVQFIREHDDKLRIILSKTDLVNPAELIRIYGALMWFLSRSLELKEVIQVFLGSFWGRTVDIESNKKLYEFDECRIFEDLSNLPKESLLRKANLLVKRSKEITIHAHLIDELRRRYRKKGKRFLVGFKNRKKHLIKNLDQIFATVEKRLNLSKSDLPPKAEFKKTLASLDWNKLPKISPYLFSNKDRFANEIIPQIVSLINETKAESIFDEEENPFAFFKGEGFDEGRLEHRDSWIVDKFKHQWTGVFDSLADKDGKICAATAKVYMLKSKLRINFLAKIWSLSDVDRDGMLDLEEFLLAMYLINVKIKMPEQPIPKRLPHHLIPPSKR